jgi:hypothetical protein
MQKVEYVDYLVSHVVEMLENVNPMTGVRNNCHRLFWFRGRSLYYHDDKYCENHK